MEGIDPARIAIMGGSYGGYLTACCLARDPEYLFACGVMKFGDSNLVSSWAQCERRLRLYTEIFLGHPACNRQVYLKAKTGAVVWETTDPEWSPGGGQWSFTSVTVGSGVICVLSGNQVWLFAAENGKRLAGPLATDNLKGGTSLAVAGDSLVTRGTKAVVCYKAQRSSQEPKP